MRTITLLLISLLAAATWGGSASAGKVDAMVLYAGRRGSERQRDFAGFLQSSFSNVGTCDLATFSEETAAAFDVVILDYDAEECPRPRFSECYGVPTVTVGEAGAHIGGTNRLKTGYL